MVYRFVIEMYNFDKYYKDESDEITWETLHFLILYYMKDETGKINE
jgi:hypothetical protein